MARRTRRYSSALVMIRRLPPEKRSVFWRALRDLVALMRPTRPESRCQRSGEWPAPGDREAGP